MPWWAILLIVVGAVIALIVVLVFFILMAADMMCGNVHMSRKGELEARKRDLNDQERS